MFKTVVKYRIILSSLWQWFLRYFSSVLQYFKTTKSTTYIPTCSVNAALVDTAIQYKKYHKIADFALVNQNGDSITQADYNGKIYVADFFFTTCQTICPIMTDHMYQIQQQTLSDPHVMLLSHSVTPEIDSVTQLKR